MLAEAAPECVEAKSVKGSVVFGYPLLSADIFILLF